MSIPQTYRPRMRVRGFSLVEMMVALAAGLIVTAALVTFLMASFRSNSEYVLTTRLTQELRNSLDLAIRDLRRAGYDQSSMTLIATGNGSPFSPMLLGDVQADGTFQCVIYGYDRRNISAGSAEGQVDIANGEVRGLRRKVVAFNGNNIGVLEYAVSTAAGRPTCAGGTGTYTTFPPACHATSHWCPLSDPSIVNITALSLDDNSSIVGTAPTQVVLRDIGVSLSGQLANASDLPARTITTEVRIRSDCYNATLANCNQSP